MPLLKRQFFSTVLSLIGVAAVLTNLALMWIAWRLRYCTKEIRLAVLLASVDTTLAIFTIWTSVLSSWNGGFEHMIVFCKYKGPFDFLLLYLSLVLVALIAMTRYFKIREASIPLPIWIVTGSCTTLYAILISVVAAQGEFAPSWSGCDCTPNASKSLISASLLFFLGFSMFVSLLATLFAYLRVLCFVKETKLMSSHNLKAKHKVMVRVIGISCIYLFLIAPSSMFIMLEGSRNSNESTVLNGIISILNALNNIANPCIVLFAHSSIYEQLRLIFRSIWTTNPDNTLEK
ncbi:hypothetical protein DSO57_1019728 [Entomophthora muscae]|uniref:Uncharacterized protein n=1 Tax=Entomophthora muscae TaxID=34485 RepID=A0ACC2T3Y3_9FUNG|nr:hypothetical protein DSO57_1019728 [Entomophthora muscae]